MNATITSHYTRRYARQIISGHEALALPNTRGGFCMQLTKHVCLSLLLAVLMLARGTLVPPRPPSRWREWLGHARS
jgi:hypothetical protein